MKQVFLRFIPARRISFSTFATLFLVAASAKAVIVRGTVTDPLGAVVIGAKVQLVQGQQVIAFGVSDVEGAFEIRSTGKGRFRLLTSAATFTPGIGKDFYGDVTQVVPQTVVLAIASVTQDVTVTATGIETPIEQTSASVSVIPYDDFATRIGIVDPLRQTPGVQFVQQGQLGGVTSLFVRGGNSTANKVLVDGITAEDVGGVFDYGTVSQTGISSIEIYRGSNSVLYGSDAGASVVSISTPRGESIKPLFVYRGEGGSFSTYRNQAEVSGTHQRLDYYAAFSRLNSSNALPLDEYHSITEAANIGYALLPGLKARFTLRNGVSASGLPGAQDFFGISNNGKEADQDLYSGLTLESSSFGDRWHNLARYGVTRKREQIYQYAYEGTPVTFTVGGDFPYSYTEYFGNVVTIRGANGYSSTGQTSFFGANSNSSSNRYELYYQSDLAVNRHFAGLLGFRYEDERGSFVVDDPSFPSSKKTTRRNYEYTLQFQGDIKNRLFYSLGGAVEKNHLYGTAGTPRLGLAYVPVRTSNGKFRGTKLRANAATGVQEPSLSLEFASLYQQVLANDPTGAEDIAAFGIRQATAQRSRSYDIGVDQNILGQRLIFKAGYFHNVFDRQLEGVDANGLRTYFNIPVAVANTLFTGYVNSLAFRAQGVESEIQWQAMQHLFVRGGYTYLNAKVIQSFATDAVNANDGVPTTNPNLPGIAIGALSPLVGARPFRRPPHSGFFAVQYSQSKFSAGMTGALASRSDDSTFLEYSDINGDNTLLLPNRNLDFGYAKLDAHASFAATRKLTVFTQLDNLLSQQHIGPIGYPALPFTARAGLIVRFGGE